jgi:hypothetical protein
MEEERDGNGEVGEDRRDENGLLGVAGDGVVERLEHGGGVRCFAMAVLAGRRVFVFRK